MTSFVETLEQGGSLPPDLFPEPIVQRMILDVESVGLHGKAFAWGYAVIDQHGKEYDSCFMWCEPDADWGTQEDFKWVQENVMPELRRKPPMELNSLHDLRQWFWRQWEHWREQGATLWGDCCWPVEANFLSACIADDPDARNWKGPYPLHDVATVFESHDMDPLLEAERLPEHLPKHHPLNDARHSAKQLLQLLYV